MKRISNILESQIVNEKTGLTWSDILTELQIAGYKIKEISKGKKIEAVGGPNPTPDKMIIEWDGKNEKTLKIWTDEDNFKTPLDLDSIADLMDELMSHFTSESIASEDVDEDLFIFENKNKDKAIEQLLEKISE